MRHVTNLMFVAFITFYYSRATCASEIRYDIYHYPEKLNIRLQFIGEDNGVTKLNIPDKIWGHDVSKQISNIIILDNNAELKDFDTLHYKKNSRINISYDVANINVVNSNKYFYTKSYEEGYFFLHDLALIYPQHPGHTNVIINYHSSKNFEYFYISDTIKTGQKISTTLEELKGGISISGSNKILQKANSVNSTMLGFDVTQENFTKLQYLTNQVLNSQKDVCNINFGVNNFVFIGNKSEYQSYRGSVFKNNLILFFVPNLIEELTFKKLASHENFHKLIGSKSFIRFNPKDKGKYKWFSEGFTDFFAQKNNLTHNLISYKEYLAMYNNIIERYFTSPYRNNSNIQLLSQYWQNTEAKQTLYDRGYIIANELDLAVNRASGKSLEDVLCVMLERFRAEESLFFSKKILVETIKFITKQDFELKIDDLIDGKISLSDLSKNKLSGSDNQQAPKLYLIPKYIHKCK